ncbi:MAG: hypothetical protein M1133_02565 [Armatimonadetes bacterium]|nr:hypothetical protein [Armatimonadota bacterium]
MTSRERVLAAIDHKPVDRVPRVFKGTPEVEAQVVRELGLQSVEDIEGRFRVENLHWPFRWLTVPDPRQKDLPDGGWVDRWGIVRKKVDYGHGTYDEPVGAPLADARSVADTEAFNWPDPGELDFSLVDSELRKYSDMPIAGAHFGVFETAYGMRGYQQFLEDLLIEPDMVEALVRRIDDYWSAYNNRIWTIGTGRIQILMSGDDFGTQRSLVMSKELWKRYFEPVYRRAYEWAKQRGLRTMIHCDGAICEIIPDLIDMGLDVLDPIQPMATGMDAYRIKREFGKDLCLHGTVDVQGLLPFGQPSRIKDEVKRQIEVLGEGSGFILAPSHCIQPGVPVENIVAIYEAADEMC